MRRLFTAQEAYKDGISPSALRWGIQQRKWARVCKGVYVEGRNPPTAVEKAVAVVLACNGIASGPLAGMLHGLDGVILKPPFATVPTSSCSERSGIRRFDLQTSEIVEVGGVPCTNGLQTLIGLAAVMDDLQWEQALESALHKRLLTIADIGMELERLRPSRVRGVGRIRRVLRLRPEIPPTESLLETLMVQLLRNVDGIPEPTRQVEVRDAYDRFVARIDLAWPSMGLFLELDGQHHKDQPVYDASRETDVVATTGWIPGRFTWDEVTRTPKSTGRRMKLLYGQALARSSHIGFP